MYLAAVYVTIKENVLDPQGQAVTGALRSLGFDEAKGVRVGKYLEVTLEAEDRADAEARAADMCERLLANPVIEDYRIEVRSAEEAPSS